MFLSFYPLIIIDRISYINHNFIFEMRPKNKFYQLTPHQKEGQKINDIYKLISHQEQTMAELLSKYQDKNQREYSYKTVESPNFQIDSAMIRGKSQSARLESITLQLPSINSHKKPNKKKNKAKGTEKNLYYVDAKSPLDKIALKDHLEKAYGTERLKLNKSKSKIQPTQNQIPRMKKIESQKNQKSKQQQSQKQSMSRTENQLPIPLGYLKDNVEQDSSSEQGQVPLTYYQKQYRSIIRSQSLEQTNFLYFSKNQSIKDWTEGLLLLFQKHDKQLQSLRKKCKYLQKFDYNFFSIDIFKQT